MFASFQIGQRSTTRDRYIKAMDAVSMEKNGEFIGGNYGEGIKDTPW